MLWLSDFWLIVGCYFLFTNAAAFALFWFDKRASERGGWRIPEKSLLLFCAAGGSFGGIWAQQRLRHKTKKQPFKSYLYIIFAAQLVLVAVFLLGLLRF